MVLRWSGHKTKTKKHFRMSNSVSKEMGVEICGCGCLKKVSSGRFSSLRTQSLVRRATLDRCKECGLNKGE